MKKLLIIIVTAVCLLSFCKDNTKHQQQSPVTVDFSQTATFRQVVTFHEIHGRIYRFDSRQGTVQTKMLDPGQYTICYELKFNPGDLQCAWVLSNGPYFDEAVLSVVAYYGEREKCGEGKVWAPGQINPLINYYKTSLSCIQ